jgi:hypothetical protein
MFGLDKVNELLRGKPKDPAAKLEADLTRAEAAADEIRLYKSHNGKPLEDPQRAMENTNTEIQRIRLELEKMKPPVIQPSGEGVDLPSAKKPFEETPQGSVIQPSMEGVHPYQKPEPEEVPQKTEEEVA